MARHDAVFIRKSTDEQSVQGQKDNVNALLRQRNLSVPDEHWFVTTESRRKVKHNEKFKELLELVQQDRVDTVYIESQDRWGTADRLELFSVLEVFREHNSKLVELRTDNDLTKKDLATELLAFIGSVKSENELKDISYRSLRTRVNNFKQNGSWPTGPQPFGYAKACYAPGATTPRWVWHPCSRTRGQVFNAGANGRLLPGESDIAIPRKDRSDSIKLVPHRNKAYRDSVRLVFELFTRAGLSRRQISARLNAEGRRFYDKPFTHSLVTQILTNPAYIGDTHFGKSQFGELHTFNADHVVIAVDKPTAKKRSEGERIIQRGTHEPLIERKVWDLAVAKLAAEAERTSFAPRNPDYYLKTIFVCGHCGKNMTGRTEIHPTTKERSVVYMCSSYIVRRTSGIETGCGAHRITHADAERLLLERLAERNQTHEVPECTAARSNVRNRLVQLGLVGKGIERKWRELVDEGVTALCEHYRHEGVLGDEDFARLRKRATRHYWGAKLNDDSMKPLPIKFKEFVRTVRDLEAAAVEEAKAKLAELQQEHSDYTKQWVKASKEMQQVMRERIAELEAEIKLWKPRTVPTSERLAAIYAEEDRMYAEHDTLLKELPAMEAREKGEAYRRVFQTVKLYWNKRFRPAEAKPARPRKTQRPGRYSYTLDRERIEWTYAAANLGGNW